MIVQEETATATQASQAFETDPETIRSVGSRIVQAIAAHYSNASQGLFPDCSGQELDQLLTTAPPLQGSAAEEVAKKLITGIMPGLFNAQQPDIYQLMASPLPLLALFETIPLYLNAQPYGALNARIQATVTGWLGSLTGFAARAEGIFTRGGTASNLYALAAARIHCLGREFRKKGTAAYPPLTAYVSKEGHACLDKAIELLGIGSDHLRKIAVRNDFTIDTEQLEQQIREDLANGYRPFCIIANGGTARTGAVDPIAALAGLAAAYGLWLHIDGAYGAFAAFTAQARPYFTGIERAHSISLDPHKWMSVPYDCSCLLVRDAKWLEDSFENVPDYLGMFRADSGRTFSRHFDFTQSDKALKVWLAFQLYGTENYTRLFESHLHMAAAFAAIIRERQDFELCHEPRLSICCFRYLPADLREQAGKHAFYINNLNRAIELAVKEKEMLITTAVLNGHTVLRVCFISHRITSGQVARLAETIHTTGHAIDAKARRSS